MNMFSSDAFSGYQSVIEIHDGANSRVYRARRKADDRPVILKVLKAEYPTPDQLRRYRQEYHLTQHLQLANVIRAYGVQEWQRTLVIILEDFGGVPLHQWLQSYPQGVPIARFLPIAGQIAHALAQLHGQGVIHKDINPSNIVFNPETLTLKLIDLGISTQLSRETPCLQPPSVLEGTLAYLSPEQTGRMNRTLDYRTDFYSLGVTFYELLCGKLPFVSNDPIELVHCHIARQPASLQDVKPGQIPPVLAELVSKLMAKNSEDRYQSAWGLKADLEKCAAQWNSTHSAHCVSCAIAARIPSFSLGKQDVSNQLSIPQRLYGRERELAILLAAFEQVAGSEGSREQGAGEQGAGSREQGSRGAGSRGAGEQQSNTKPIHPSTHPPHAPRPTPHAPRPLLLVTGCSGVGKSALVRSLHPAITARRGYFIAGKFDQFQRSTPYSALVDAFASLVKQLLGEADRVLQQWRSRLLEALEGNGQIVIDVIPDVALIIGAQPPVPDLGVSETQNRFNRVFQRFMQALCTPEHPLVLFLDDLQWADQATLNLLERLLGDNPIRHLLLVGAYRSSEVSAGHSLGLTIARLQQQGANLTQITLDSLSLQQVQQIIGDTLHQEPVQVKPLAELVRRKTAGNPFFINQFLQTLYREALLSLDTGSGQWQWNLAQIEAIGFTDNVVELMVSQLQKLPQSVQSVLSTAAYLGTTFDLETLSLLQNRSPADLFADLKLAIDRDLVVGRSPLDENLLIQRYQFGHDRIQQAAYSLTPADQQQITHLRIGRLMLAQTSPQAGTLFDLLYHFTIALPLIQDPAEQEMLAQLNLQAAQRARASTAYTAAIAYARTGLQLINAVGWQQHYELTLALHEALTEAACLTGDRPTVLALVQVVLSQAKNPLDRVKTCEILIQFHCAQKQHAEAIACGLELLQILNIKLPARPSALAVLRALLQTKIALCGKSNEALLNLPDIHDRKQQAAVRILHLLMLPAYFVSPHLMVILFTAGIGLTLRYGNSPAAAGFYGSYGIVLARLGNLRQSYRFGKLALAFTDRLGDLAITATVKTSVSWHCQPWQEPLQATLPILEDGIKAALSSGNLIFLGIAAYLSLGVRLDLGTPIEEFADQIATAKELIAYSGDENSKFLLDIYCQGIFNLQHLTDQPALLAKDTASEARLIARFQAQGEIAALSALYGFKTFLAYLFGDTGAAVEYADAQLPHEVALKGGYVITYIWFYDSLARLAIYPQSNPARQRQLLKRVRLNQRHLHKHARLMPVNFRPMHDLVEAEKFRILGRFSPAIDCYERSIAGYRERSCPRGEALALELAAKFYLSWGKQNIARVYLTEARYAYSRWGAAAKVQQIEQQYPQLCETFARSTAIPTKLSLHSDRRIAADLDIATLLKASRAIASEMVLEQLLQTLMAILLENAGAQAGCLLLPAAAEPENSSDRFPEDSPEAFPTNSPANFPANFPASFTVAIHSHSDRAASLSLPLHQILPESLLHYVARTQTSIVLNQTDRWGEFEQDTYLQAAKPLSVLCYPLLHQRELVGIVYLENRITAGVFTADRIEFLQLLSGQMAIALINARLYAEKLDYTRMLEQNVAERTAELRAANAELLRLATVDNLTKIANRRRFDDYLTAEWQRHLREQRSLVLILMDIDYFKRFNDCYGHQCGDDCLIRVAQTLAQSLQRPADLIARYGGEEFAAILPNTTLQGGLVVAEAMRAAIAALTIPHAQSDVSSCVTLSLGVAALRPTLKLSPDLLIAHADQALYQAKHKGRNRATAHAV